MIIKQKITLTWDLGVNLNSFANGFSLDLDKMLQNKCYEIETDITKKQQINYCTLICHILVK